MWWNSIKMFSCIDFYTLYCSHHENVHGKWVIVSCIFQHPDNTWIINKYQYITSNVSTKLNSLTVCLKRHCQEITSISLYLNRPNTISIIWCPTRWVCVFTRLQPCPAESLPRVYKALGPGSAAHSQQRGTISWLAFMSDSLSTF